MTAKAIGDGVGSVREIARLCASVPAYRWLCGGVSLNQHALSDFRTDETLCLDNLLARPAASLLAAGLIDRDEVAQDEVRADAGAASFRRRPTLERELDKARVALTRLDRDEAEDPGATGRRRALRQAAL
ncbi:hypothetical protein [Methylobacterium sp. GC_Met_2]|uniref:hypothetical protein n=1 Tax=Methylobacterium sp. GC_Met_2 TaxID=2937376 RepID=UPI00226B969B|nr:hypothetical protein [Methylobacterium sp. GC_Met_2]